MNKLSANMPTDKIRGLTEIIYVEAKLVCDKIGIQQI